MRFSNPAQSIRHGSAANGIRRPVRIRWRFIVHDIPTPRLSRDVLMSAPRVEESVRCMAECDWMLINSWYRDV